MVAPPEHAVFASRSCQSSRVTAEDARLEPLMISWLPLVQGVVFEPAATVADRGPPLSPRQTADGSASTWSAGRRQIPGQPREHHRQAENVSDDQRPQSSMLPRFTISPPPARRVGARLLKEPLILGPGTQRETRCRDHFPIAGRSRINVLPGGSFSGPFAPDPGGDQHDLSLRRLPVLDHAGDDRLREARAPGIGALGTGKARQLERNSRALCEEERHARLISRMRHGTPKSVFVRLAGPFRTRGKAAPPIYRSTT